METENVVYISTEGWKEVRVAPKDTHPSDYNKGVLIGPPDISFLKIKSAEKKALNNALVDAKFIAYPDLKGRRAELLRIIAREVTSVEAYKIRLQLIGAYQQDYYPSVFEETT